VTVERLLLLLIAPAVAVLAVVLAVIARRRRVAAAAAWSSALGGASSRLGRRSPLVLGVAALIAAVGLAGPRWGVAARATESRALNIAVVMDISKSMLAEDVAPNRLGRAGSLARRLVHDLDGDRLALVAFAARGYTLAPLTLDESAIALQLDALDPDIASEGGSGLASGLDDARQLLQASQEGGDRAVVLFTDGESFEPPATLEAAGRALARDRVTLITIPIGGVKGARIPDPDGGFHRDAKGQEVITTRRDDLLKLVNDAANGVLVPADAPDPVGDAVRVLDRLTRSPARDRVAADLVPRAWLFALVAGLLLLAHALTRRSAALVGVLLALGLGRAQAQRPGQGTRLLDRGDTTAARRAFASEAKRVGSDTAWYNAGTAALTAGDLVTATDALQRATLSLDPELRRRALYNLGTAYLLQSRRDSVRRSALLTQAAKQLQEALLIAPEDSNAKFNYELARRLRPPPSSSAPSPRGNSGGLPRAPTPQEQRAGMTQAQAEQVLSAMERAERDTRRRQNQQVPSGSPRRGPDW
jgi:Ca-activated chloride channel family protein